MNHELDEIEPAPRRVGLDNVKYRYNNEEHITTLLLEIGKHNKNLIKKKINKQVNIPFRSISGIKLKFRKQVLNYNSGYEGTRKYFDDLGLQVRDYFRIMKEKKTVQKGYADNFSRRIYHVIQGNGYTFSLQDENGHRLDRKYKYHELRKVTKVEKYLN